MNVLDAPVVEHPAPTISYRQPQTPAMARIALLGVGNVGRAVLQRLERWPDTPRGLQLRLVFAANSRHMLTDRAGVGVAAAHALNALPTIAGSIGHTQRSDLDAVAATLGDAATRIVIDATASEAVADRHAQWLSQGIHVVTACKLATGSSLARWQAVSDACQSGGVDYGDAATVGAGLPLLRSLRELQAGGDRIRGIAGILSGSMAWLFNQYDGSRPFSETVREAFDAGLTEPDPRDDLSGEDVRRKLLILARSAGVLLEPVDIEVQSLVPPAMSNVGDVEGVLAALDAPMRERFNAAHARGESLRFLARLQANGDGGWQASVGLESLPPQHPLAGGSGTDNRVAIWSDRYDTQPLVIQGPGAGAQVTAAGLLDDVLRIVRRANG